ncbi:squalene synthase HpnC [Stieleria sp. TO1_6]|uniref:squalene synthase HpnC n=1 Tax=Stieleria tagensis TaxID=2956795 RepID=UPI00209AD155|nr:squalene synthase HpnC [Stieleria tagensis]MCO8124920.1 squalene synthase HpnC [Stieleria tagensis]
MSSGRTLSNQSLSPPAAAAAPQAPGDAPQAPDPSQRAQLRQSRRVCRRIARSHYENFLVASILLPRRLRQPFYNIYAFCRTADDLADESADPQIALRGLQQLQTDLDATFAGAPPVAAPPGLFPALAETIAGFGLSKQPFDDLLSAFRQDQHLVEYATTAELIDYCRCSANPVGRLVLELAGVRNETTEHYSDKICTGLQLANFWQDVARDHQIGRIYLPGDARQQFAVDTEMLAEPHSPPQLRRLLEKLCDDAEGYLRDGLPLAHHIPRWLAGDIKLFAHGGLATLAAIREIDFDVLHHRPRVGKWKQIQLVSRALLGRL